MTTGDWSRLTKVLTDQQTMGRDIGRANMTAAAELVAERAREKLGVYQGAVGPYPAWPDLKAETIARKAGQADTPLLETSQMRDDITVGEQTIDSNRHASITLGIQADAKSAPYATVQEMGRLDQSIPARPFLGPALWETKEMVRDDLKAAIRALFVL